MLSDDAMLRLEGRVCEAALDHERPLVWDARHIEALAALMPHLRRALESNRHVGDMQIANELAGEALHRLDRGVVLMDARGFVLFANRAAESIFARGAGLGVEQRRLTASKEADEAALERLIADATRNGSAGSMVIAREQRPSLIVLATPVRQEKSPMDGGASAVVFIKDLERPSHPSLATFAQHFELTPTQAALAHELLQTDGVAAAAKRLGTSYATARSHLAQIFQKTGTCRQAELIRLMLSWDEAFCFSQDAKS
ncbi:MAG TPA: hypothetical protein VFL51_04660 [Pseudolabrys sp.]|nr:hypothetical protein [Pseudolabrys sp.]